MKRSVCWGPLPVSFRVRRAYLLFIQEDGAGLQAPAGTAQPLLSAAPPAVSACKVAVAVRRSGRRAQVVPGHAQGLVAMSPHQRPQLPGAKGHRVPPRPAVSVTGVWLQASTAAYYCFTTFPIFHLVLGLETHTSTRAHHSLLPRAPGTEGWQSPSPGRRLQRFGGRGCHRGIFSRGKSHNLDLYAAFPLQSTG